MVIARDGVDGSRAAELVATLVRLRSQNPDDGEKAIAVYVAEQMRKLGLEVSTPETLPDRPSVVARLSGGSGPVLVFNTHLDTVPAGSGWSDNPFSGATRGGRVFGRGAADAKASLAAFMLALEELVGSRSTLKGDVVLMGVVDEEVGSQGSRALCSSVRADAAVIGEPTGLSIAIAHRGAVRPVISVSGRAAHSSRPLEGVSAISASVLVIAAIEAYARDLELRSHHYCGNPTVSITQIAGGTAPNVVPDRCEIVVDRRLIPGETEADAIREITERLITLTLPSGAAATIDRFLPVSGGASELPVDHPFVTVAADAVRACGHSPTIVGFAASCDMTHFRSLGIPAVVLGPGDLEEAHRANESVGIIDVIEAAAVYASLARGFMDNGLYQIEM